MEKGFGLWNSDGDASIFRQCSKLSTMSGSADGQSWNWIAFPIRHDRQESQPWSARTIFTTGWGSRYELPIPDRSHQ